MDARSDLYSFGVVLYEMLSGKAPFEAQTPEAYLGKHLHTPAPPLDTSRLPASVGQGLAAIVQRALEKRRERRFRDAREFLLALERLQPRGTEPASEAPTTLMRARRPARRTAIAAGLALAAVGALVAVFLASGSSATTTGRDPGGGTHLRRYCPPTSKCLAIPSPEPDPAAAGALVGAVRTLFTATPTVAEPTRPAPEAEITSAARPPEEAQPNPGMPGPEEARQLLERWRSRPADARAHTALDVAHLANRFVQAYPDDPLAAEMRERLPEAFKRGAETAWNNARPLLAALYYRAVPAAHVCAPGPGTGPPRGRDPQRRAASPAAPLTLERRVSPFAPFAAREARAVSGMLDMVSSPSSTPRIL